MSLKRDKYLDFYRGVAAVSIIFIHTVFWSGENYIPDYLRTLALLLDVPFFVFLSGWSVYYSSNIIKIFDNIIRIWLRYILFISLIDIIEIVFLHTESLSLSVWLNQCFFAVKGTTPNFRVVTGSLWFLPMWIPVVLVGGACSIFLKENDSHSNLCKRLLLFFLVGIISYSTGRITTYFLLPHMFCFYMFFFLLGYYFACNYVQWTRIQYIGICVMLGFLWLLSGHILHVSPQDLQTAKFPPNMMYLAVSLLSVTTALFLRNKLNIVVEKCSLLIFIGKNALCFYFAQGIGSSLLYHVYPLFLSAGWELTLMVCFLINFAITLVLGTMLVYFYQGIHFILQNKHQI